MEDRPSLIERIREELVGQGDALSAILPYVDIWNAGLHSGDRPIGNFLLLGPSGSGKTKTVEALAYGLHGSEHNVVRVDCGEFQLDHEVAKLIGSPPGYLGHRETRPLLTQQKLNEITSRQSDIALVLFDEIEKAAGTLVRLLLGVLDKGVLKLGDNTTVSFCSSMIFLTSNLGARQMSDMLTEKYGFKSDRAVTKAQLMRAGTQAARKKFSPEFLNRIDWVVAYEPLKDEEYRKILSIQMEKLQALVDRRLGDMAYRVCLTEEGKAWVLERGCSKEYGAREMKRVLHRNVVSKLARMRPKAGSVVRFGVQDGELVAVEAAS